MSIRIDASLYPDEPPPEELVSIGDRVEYLARLCGAWDFGLLPDPDVIDQLVEPDWRDAVDRCWHGLPPLAFLGSVPASIAEDPSLAHI